MGFKTKSTGLAINIEDRFDNANTSITSLAKENFMDRTTLFRKIKKATGNSPQQNLQDQRLRAAAAHLRAGQNVSRAAYAAGYNDPSYFTRLFRQIIGLTPSEYRKKHQR